MERELPTEQGRSVPDEQRSKNRQLTKDLRVYLLKQGADLVGFSSVDRLEGAPKIMRPPKISSRCCNYDLHRLAYK